jgi:hypothetical protein
MTAAEAVAAVGVRRRGITLAQLWAYLAVALPVLGALIAGLSSVDLAYHLRAGEMTLDTGRIPTVDTFTYTAFGAPWLNQQWGAQVVLAGVYRLGGWTALTVFRAALVGLTFGLLFEACRRRGLDLRRAAWLTLAAFVVSAVALALRPQLLGMTLMALTLLLVADRRAHPRRLLAVPVIVLVWANVHGSFFLGPVVLLLAWLEDVHDHVPNPHRVLGLAAVSVGASLVNPFGPAIWAYAAGLTTNAFVTSQISEWQPTTLRTIPGLLFFGSAALVVALLARRGRPTPWPSLAWLAVFAAIGAYAIRGVAWWPLGAAVTVAGLLAVDLAAGAAGSATARARVERVSRLNRVVAAAIAVACLVLIPFWRPVDPGTGAPTGLIGDAPPGITTALRSMVRPGDHVLNPQPWGSWFELAVPDALQTIDSRIEIFPADVWHDYNRVWSGGDGWEDVLSRWAPRIAITTSDDAALRDRLVAIGWRAAFADRDGTLLVAP